MKNSLGFSFGCSAIAFAFRIVIIYCNFGFEQVSSEADENRASSTDQSEEKGWGRARLADEFGINRPRINVIVKGTENLTLDIITQREDDY